MKLQPNSPDKHDSRLWSGIAGAERTRTSDAQLGMVLTFVAGAINAGGFLAIGQYTSHMSGIFSAMADNVALGAFELVGAGLAAFIPFVAGAATSAFLINWGRRHAAGIQYAIPIMLEALLLCLLGLVGALVHPISSLLLSAVPPLCFIMGLQNATVTKLSGARIRTTHITGLVTDLGIELGKLLFVNRDDGRSCARPGGQAQNEIAVAYADLFLRWWGDGCVRLQDIRISVRDTDRAAIVRHRRADPRCDKIRREKLVRA